MISPKGAMFDALVTCSSLDKKSEPQTVLFPYDLAGFSHE